MRSHGDALTIEIGAELEAIAAALGRISLKLRDPGGVVSVRSDDELVAAWVSHRVAVDGVMRQHAEKGAIVARQFIAATRRGIQDVAAADVADWIRGQACGRKRCANVLSYLRSLGDYLVLVEVRRDNPWRAFRFARVPRSRGYDALTPDQAAALVAVAERQGRDPDGRRANHGQRRSIYYRFLWLTGLRIGEARAQRWEDVDLDRGRMVVTLDKARRRDVIPLDDAAVELLREWRRLLDERGEGVERASPRVFHRGIGRRAMLRDMEEAGIPRGRGLWHRWRVGFVTRLLDAGVPAQDVQPLSRHRTLSQTMEYDRPAEARLRAALKKARGTEATPSAVLAHARQRGKGKTSEIPVDGNGGGADIPRVGQNGRRASSYQRRHFGYSPVREGPTPCRGGAALSSTGDGGGSANNARLPDDQQWTRGESNPTVDTATVISLLAEAAAILARLTAERLRTNGTDPWTEHATGCGGDAHGAGASPRRHGPAPAGHQRSAGRA